MIEKGTLLRTKTRTNGDVFGVVIWEVVETGMKAPEKERVGMMDGVRCVIVGGTGRAARKGYMVYDSEAQIEADIASGITTVIPPGQKEKLLSAYGAVVKEGQSRCAGGIEMG